MKQYFSKLHKKWVDLKYSDCEESLRKYKYKSRQINEQKATPVSKLAKDLNITIPGLEHRSKKDGSFFKGPVYIKHEEDYLRVGSKFQNVIIKEDNQNNPLK